MSHLESAGLAALGVDDVDADLSLVHRHVDVLPLLQLFPVVAQDLHRQLRLLLSLCPFWIVKIFHFQTGSLRRVVQPVH